MGSVLSWILAACNRRHVRDEVALLSAAIAQLRQSTATASATLDATLAQLDEARGQQAECDAQARAKARAEFADVSSDAFAALIAAPPSTTQQPTPF